MTLEKTAEHLQDEKIFMKVLRKLSLHKISTLVLVLLSNFLYGAPSFLEEAPLPQQASTVYSTNFTLEEIEFAAKLARVVYSDYSTSKALQKLKSKGWSYQRFQGKSYLNGLHTAGLICFKPESSPDTGYTRHKAFIAFHGTETFHDIATDVFMSQKICHPFNTPGNVHAGFLYAFQSSITEIIICLQYYCLLNRIRFADLDIVTTGHSLGAAVSTLTSFYLSTNKRLGIILDEAPNTEINRIRNITFGCPRVGDKVFADVFKEKFGSNNSLRFTIKGDPIVNIPLESWGYYHVGKEVLLDFEVPHSASYLQKLYKAHQMDTYLYLIKKLICDLGNSFLDLLRT